MKEGLDSLHDLQKEYIELLKLMPNGGDIAAKEYESRGIPIEEIGTEIEKLKKEILVLRRELLEDGLISVD